MKVILQRVAHASVEVEGEVVGAIEQGLMLLVGIAADDSEAVLAPMAAKIFQMRIFPDDRGRFHYSLKDSSGGLLLVPQFTLFADTSKGRRPDFFGAMKPPKASELFDSFCDEFKKLGAFKVEKGVFGADMKVSLLNDGPVTISLES